MKEQVGQGVKCGGTGLPGGEVQFALSGLEDWIPRYIRDYLLIWSSSLLTLLESRSALLFQNTLGKCIVYMLC